MPSSLTSSFASAAAGSNPENRRDGFNGSEWSRRPNGTVQTFRRSSQAASASQPRDNTQMGPTATAFAPYVPPHMNANAQPGSARNGTSRDIRYSKEQLLSIYQMRKDTGSVDVNLSRLFTGPWEPLSVLNGPVPKQEGKDQPTGPEVCWNAGTDTRPFGLTDMNDTERQLFTGSVNSSIKPNAGKDGPSASSSGRKASLSGGYAATSGSSVRPGTKRRETGDSFISNGPLSPAESKTFFRSEPATSTPPPALLRRRTDFKEDEAHTETKEDGDMGESTDDPHPSISSLRRVGTAPQSSIGTGTATSPWSSGPSGSAFGPMGSFGSFAVGAAMPHDAEKKPGFGSARGASRFKDLLSKTSTEEMSPSVKEKASFGVLGKLPEEDGEIGSSRMKDVFKTRPTRSETNPYEDPAPRAESTNVESQDASGIEQTGFSAFGPPSHIGSRDFGQTDSNIRQSPHRRLQHHEPMSPTNTNPYQSPQGGGRAGDETPGEDTMGQHSAQLPYGSARRDMFSGSENRGPSSAFGAPRNASGFGALSGWGSGSFGPGTPGRERIAVSSAFGDPIFSPISDLHSPNAAGLGPGGFFGSTGFGSAGRNGRLGALFPPAMQEQMRSDSRNDAFEGRADHLAGRDPFDSGNRRNDGFRNFFEEPGSRGGDHVFAGPPHPGQNQSQTNTPGPSQKPPVGTEHQASHSSAQSTDTASSNQMPAAQQRQMVMPDRMRWVYRDPHGNVQGPWSGLEMHDWFKAGFFTAELQVKKLEDTDYEPLAQLVRRIGNSREPFLVPQIGVPHGPPSNTQGNNWAGGAISGGTAQPPFANSFPSFGTTLTAEQQNALERRKQEEQFLMARQKEHLAQQQSFMKLQMQNGPHNLHTLQHHSSAHSLHSQPSFGSITSPAGYQPSPLQGPIQPPHHGPGLGGSGPMPAGLHGPREDELHGHFNRMGFNDSGPAAFGANPSVGQGPSQLSMSNVLQDRERPSGEASLADLQSHQSAFLGQQGRNERLEEFRDLRSEMDLEGSLDGEAAVGLPIGGQRASTEDSPSIKQPGLIGQPPKFKVAAQEVEPLSLTQQVQRTAANKQAAAESSTPDVPPVSVSPLPAPAAQRNRQHIADALAAESRSASQTPVETPTTSVAPWADRGADVPKGPSLKEIQEAEARRAAEQEGLVAAARRAQVEQERVVAAQTLPPAPGLPSTSTWASSASPSTPTHAVANTWAKPIAKPTASSGPTKKTLAQIQKEEESRKQRAAAQVAATVQAPVLNTLPAASGNRYAQMAGKIVPAPSPTTGGAWTTVGTGGGKPKTPATMVASPPAAAARTVGAGSVAATVKTRPVLPSSRSTSMANQNKANEEVLKWAKGQMGKGLNSGINVDDFVQSLLAFPPEIEILSEAIYGSSQTLDGRRIAEEFLRRRKLAEKGVVEPASSGTSVDSKSGGGGWNEVAKKGPVKEESTPGFKVVSTKKKGKK